MKKHEKMSKEKKNYISKILTFIVVILFLLLLQFVMNIDSITYFNNREYYEEIRVTVKNPSTDEFVMMIPKVDIQYMYNGQVYEESKYFVLQPLFGLEAKAGEVIPAYVNKNAPNYTLFKLNFFANWLNYMFLLFQVVCICRTITYIKRRGRDKKEAKERRKNK